MTATRLPLPHPGRRPRRSRVAYRYAKRALTIVLVVASFSGPALGLDLGLTPSHVFSVWTNINNALLAYARQLPSGGALHEKIAALEPNRFAGKTPQDVFGHMEIFRKNLKALPGVREGGDEERRVLFEAVLDSLAEGETGITPSTVFIHSGELLNELVGLLIGISPPDLPVSPFYARHLFSEKVPSDVFGLVNLANRRAEKILARDTP